MKAVSLTAETQGTYMYKSRFLISRPKADESGNRNVRLDGDVVRIRDPFGKRWLCFKLLLPDKYREIVEEAKRRKYGAAIVMRRGVVYLHLNVPSDIYTLDTWGYPPRSGELIAGFDLNSDRINMVIVDERGEIRDVKTEWFPEVTSPGFPRNRAGDARLKALAKLLDYAYHHNVGTVLFEDLERVKRRRYVESRCANRKITRFAKRELLQHGIVMALRRGFKVYLVNPANTSKNAKRIHKMLGLDVHTASAYLLALRHLNL